MLGGVLLGAGLGACTIVNGNHCALNSGACGAGLVCDRCAVDNDGCVAADALTSESCLVEDSATSTGSTTSPSTTITTTTIGTSTTSTTEPTSSTEPSTGATTGSTTDPSTSGTTTEGFTCDPDVPVNFECKQMDATKPFCVATDTCGGCSELVSSSCAQIDPTNPACEETLGTCVECTAVNTQACSPTEVCNQYINDCGKCFEHDQCMSGACNLKTGACFPPENVVWVERQASCGGKDGSEAAPFCTLAQPLAIWPDKDLVMKLKPGIGPQLDALDLSSGKNIAIVGVNNPKIGATAAPEARMLLSEGTNLFVTQVRLQEASQSIVISCLGGDSEVWIDRTLISSNKVPFQTAACGKVTLQRSVVTANDNASNVGALALINSFVTSNDVGNTGTPFRLNAASEIIHSTVVANDGSISSGFYCTQNSEVKVRNSVVLGDKDPFGGCVSLTENTHVGPASDLIDLFQAAQQGVYRPKPAADAISMLAEWQIGDPYIDYDGELRPNEPGAKDFAGAARP
ncbi:MAG: hypothetical protein H6711_20670 [Myxococcales bacterium]|nr:hypothetical protein [Myxococcales bacterium]